MEITLQVFLVKWSEQFSMAKRSYPLPYTCFTIAAIGWWIFSNNLVTIFHITLFSHWRKCCFQPFASIRFRNRSFQINVDCIFQFTALHWDVSRTCGPVIGAVLLSKLNGSMLFYICACFLTIGGIIQAFFCSKFRA